MNQVYCVATTMPDLNTFISKCQDIFGVSPSRELDLKSVNVNLPSSFPMMIENINNNAQAIANLGKATISLEMINFVFISNFDDVDECSSFHNTLPGPSFRHKNKLVFSISLRQVRDFVNQNCTMKKKMYDILYAMGYKTLFKGNVNILR